jgi:chaperonin cofactor prefoldin
MRDAKSMAEELESIDADAEIALRVAPEDNV